MVDSPISDNSMMSSEPMTLECDPQGDVVFLVQDRMKLRVSSKIMSFASKPFTAMFRPGTFQEGQDLHQTFPATVSLPEDNAEAVLKLCRVLHYQDMARPEDVEEVLEILAVADKYDCITAIKAVAILWLREILDSCRESMDILPSLIIANCCIRDSKSFTAVCRKWIDSGDPPEVNYDSRWEHLCPRGVWGELFVHNLIKRASKVKARFLDYLSAKACRRYIDLVATLHNLDGQIYERSHKLLAFRTTKEMLELNTFDKANHHLGDEFSMLLLRWKDAAIRPKEFAHALAQDANACIDCQTSYSSWFSGSNNIQKAQVDFASKLKVVIETWEFETVRVCLTCALGYKTTGRMTRCDSGCVPVGLRFFDPSSFTENPDDCRNHMRRSYLNE